MYRRFRPKDGLFSAGIVVKDTLDEFDRLRTADVQMIGQGALLLKRGCFVPDHTLWKNLGKGEGMRRDVDLGDDVHMVPL